MFFGTQTIGMTILHLVVRTCKTCKRFLDREDSIILEQILNNISVRYKNLKKGNIFGRGGESGMSKIVKRKKQPGKHSSPETSGVQNLPKSYIDRVTGTGGGLMKDIMEIYKRGQTNTQEYKGLWDEESLSAEIEEYFEFCAERDVKPAKAGLRLWLGVSKSRYWEWENEKGTYKANLLSQASEFMEIQYIGRLESHPTGNIFLLKSSHGHSDRQDINITSGSNVNSEEIGDVVSKLGLDKEE